VELIRAAVIGLGQSGIMLDLDPARKEIWTHCVSIDLHKSLTIDAVVDEDKEKEKILLEKLGQQKKIAYYTDTKKMVEEINPNFVSVCAPTGNHLQIIKELSQAPELKYIFCEKPVGLSVDQTKEIISICNERQIILGTNYMRRWESKYIKIKESIAKQELGKLLAINANGATALYTSASHLIDLMVYFSGPIEEVSGVLQTDYVRDVHGTEDPGANAFFRFKNGATGHLKASSKDPQHYMFELDILFEEGRIEIKRDGEEILISDFKYSNASSGSDYMRLEKREQETYRSERMLDALSDIIECKFSYSEPKSNGDNALEVQKTIKAIIDSSNEGGIFKKIG